MCITARAFGKRGWLAVNDINHAHARCVVEAFEVFLREILRRPGEDTSNSSHHPPPFFIYFFDFKFAVKILNCFGTTLGRKWSDLILGLRLWPNLCRRSDTFSMLQLN